MKDELYMVWKESINVQMHFNDLIMKVRATTTTVITAIFGASSFFLKDSNIFISLFKYDIHISALIILIGLLFLAAFCILDLGYYLQLLLSSVRFTENIEKRIDDDYSLTTYISKRVRRRRAYISLSFYYGLIFLLGIFSFVAIMIGF